MCDLSEDEAQELAIRQFKEAKVTGTAKITCICGRLFPIRFMHKCLYCNIWFCVRCAETHFGKTRKQYYADKAAKEIAPCKNLT